MEQAYKLALEIILNKCENDGYVSVEEVKMICRAALKLNGESEASDV